VDTFNSAKRSEIMRRIRSGNTQPEIIVRSLLHKAGFRFRLNDKRLPGKPDLVLRKYKTVVFIHGCFWHEHKNCRDGRRPKSNTAYWNRKLDRNVKRDAANVERLRSIGWTPVTVWECELKDKEQVRKRLMTSLHNAKPEAV
jgi:DNA mismatch endonuclease (patch repair protein)